MWRTRQTAAGYPGREPTTGALQPCAFCTLDRDRGRFGALPEAYWNALVISTAEDDGLLIQPEVGPTSGEQAWAQVSLSADAEIAAAQAGRRRTYVVAG